MDCPTFLKEFFWAIRLLIVYYQFCNVRNVDSAELSFQVFDYPIHMNLFSHQHYFSTNIWTLITLHFAQLHSHIFPVYLYLGLWCQMAFLWTLSKVLPIGSFSGIFNQILTLVDSFWILIYWTNGMAWLCSQRCLLWIIDFFSSLKYQDETKYWFGNACGLGYRLVF